MADAPAPSPALNPLQPLIDEAKAITDRVAAATAAEKTVLQAQYGERLKHIEARLKAAETQ